MINYQFYPKSERLPNKLLPIVEIFQTHANEISSENHQLKSNDVLHIVANDIEKLGYLVERGKKAEEKIHIPVLFGRNGSIEKSFDADCYNADDKVVIEVEAGRAVTNYQFLKDIFQACVMCDVDYLVVAVRNIYITQNDFETVNNFLEALYASNRFTLPLKGILVVGY